MRRVAVAAVLLAAAAAVAPAAPAAAHVCADPLEVPVGEPVRLVLRVPAESRRVVAVDVEVPAGFAVDRASGAGWRASTAPGVARFEGGSVAAFSCGEVVIEGTAERKGRLVFPLVLRTVDGRTIRLDTPEPFHPEGAQLVYAGVDAPSPPGERDLDPLEVAGWALVGAGVVGFAAFGVRRARART